MATRTSGKKRTTSRKKTTAKSARRGTTARKASARKTSARKPARKASTKKPARKTAKSAARKPAARKTAARKAPARKPAAATKPVAPSVTPAATKPAASAPAAPRPGATAWGAAPSSPVPGLAASRGPCLQPEAAGDPRRQHLARQRQEPRLGRARAPVHSLTGRPGRETTTICSTEWRAWSVPALRSGTLGEDEGDHPRSKHGFDSSTPYSWLYVNAPRCGGARH